MMYHYLYAPSKGGHVHRVLTNTVKPEIARAYRKSFLTNKVVTLDKGAILVAINTGSWEYPTIQHRAIEKGIPFRILSYDMKTVKTWSEEAISNLVNMSNFALASASNLTVIKFYNYHRFDLRPLGIIVENSRKLTKRLTEVMRCSGHYLYDPLGDQFSIKEFKTPEGEYDSTYDGMNYMRESLARRLGFKERRGNVRVTTELGLIKGDVIVVPDSQLTADFVYHTENLKSEYRSTGWQLITIMKHGDVKEVGHNDQIRFNFPTMITNSDVRNDLEAFAEGWKKSLETGGDLHNYLVSQQGFYEDPIAVDLDRITMAHRLEEQAELLMEVGIAPAVFSNIPYTRTGAMVRRGRAHQMKNADDQPIPYFKKTFIPARNAFSAAVVSYGSLTKMGGFDLSHMEEDGTRTFTIDGIGLVVPDSRFEETYALHGGDDHDDTWNGYRKRFYCTDPAKLQMLRDNYVLDPTLDIGTSKEDATEEGALFIRMPNGPGEYSIERVAPDMPWTLVNDEAVSYVDLADAPLPQNLVFEGAEVEELVASVSYDGPYDAQFATNAILAQVVNPNVGPFANAIMAASATFGPDNIPDSMKKLKMEEAIDTVQQEADILKFTVIADAVKSMWIEYLDHVVTNQIKVDVGLLLTRIPEKVGAGDEAVFIGRRIMELKLVQGGVTHHLHRVYDNHMTEMSQLAKDVTKRARNELPLSQQLANARISPDLLKFAEGWIKGCNVALRRIDNEYRNTDTEENEKDAPLSTLVKRAMQEEKRLRMEHEMDRWVNAILENERYDTHKQVVALYKWIVTPREGFPLGDIDRVFVQPSSPGAVSMLQLFIEACNRWNLLGNDTIIHARRLGTNPQA